MIVVGLDSFVEGLSVAAKTAQKVIEATALDIALQMRRLAQGKAPIRTSALAQSIQASPITYGAMTEVGEKYGIYVEEGTGLYDPRGAHLIYPKTAKALIWSEGGETYGARWTRGMEAQPFFGPAFDEVLPYADEKMNLAADGLIKTAIGAAL